MIVFFVFFKHSLCAFYLQCICILHYPFFTGLVTLIAVVITMIISIIGTFVMMTILLRLLLLLLRVVTINRILTVTISLLLLYHDSCYN